MIYFVKYYPALALIYIHLYGLAIVSRHAQRIFAILYHRDINAA